MRTGRAAGIPTQDPDIESRRGVFRDIFAKLRAIGVEPLTLLLAWDFHTASRESLLHRMLHMRDDAVARLPAAGPTYEIRDIQRNFSAHIDAHIRGVMHVPLYMHSALPGSELVLDANDRPVFQRLTPVQFTILVPRSLIERGAVGRILQYGHGLFGSQSEVTVGYLQEQANRYGYVLAATDWWGLAQDDVPAVAVMIATNVSRFRIVPDRCHQGILNNLLLMRLLRSRLATELRFNARPVMDPTRVSYYGNSEGGILGGVYMALSQDVTRGCLGVFGVRRRIVALRCAGRWRCVPGPFGRMCACADRLTRTAAPGRCRTACCCRAARTSRSCLTS